MEHTLAGCRISHIAALLSLLAALVQPALAQTPQAALGVSKSGQTLKASSGEPEPILAYYAGQTDHDLLLRTVVYDNGLVIYRMDIVRLLNQHNYQLMDRIQLVSPVLQSVQLSASELSHLLSRIQPEKLTRLSSVFQTALSPHYKLAFWQNGQKKEIVAGGLLFQEGFSRDFTRAYPADRNDISDVEYSDRIGVPHELYDAFQQMEYFTDKRSTPWAATEYELFFRQAQVRGKVKNWPKSLLEIDLPGSLNPSESSNAEIDA